MIGHLPFNAEFRIYREVETFITKREEAIYRMKCSEDRFYCVSCGQMVSSPEADILFRTGFFRVVHPMGYCLSCSIEQDKLDAKAGSPGKTSNYDYKMFLRADAKAAEHVIQPYRTNNNESLCPTV